MIAPRRVYSMIGAVLVVGMLGYASSALAGAVAVGAAANTNGYFKYQFFRNGINFFSSTYSLRQSQYGYYLRITAEVPLGGDGCGYYACVVPQNSIFGPAKWTGSKCVSWWQDGYSAQFLGDLSFTSSYYSASPAGPADPAIPRFPSTTAIELAPALPNPAHGEATLQFSLPQPVSATLDVYDAAGRLTRHLLNGQFDAGVHIVQWDGRNEAGNRAPSGVYFYRLVSGSHQETQRLLLLQ